MAHCGFVTAQRCTLTKSYTVLAWQLTTANIKHVLSLGWERESASDAPDRTNRWWGWGEFFFPVSLCCGPVLDTRLPQCVARLGHSPFWCSSAFCPALLGIWRLPNGFQVCKHINIEAGRETRTRHATYYCWWEIGKDPSLRNVTHRLVFVWSANYFSGKKEVQNPPYLLPEWAWSRQKAFVTIWWKWQMSSVVGLCVLIAPFNPLLCWHWGCTRRCRWIVLFFSKNNRWSADHTFILFC